MVTGPCARGGAAESAYQDPTDNPPQDSGPVRVGTLPLTCRGEYEGWRPMSQVTRVRARPHLTLNSDGQKHTVVNALAIFTLIAGVVAFALGFIVARHFIASWIGLAALLVGFYAQMISATREQRIVIVTGLVAGFVGLMLAFAHGGPFL